MDIIYPMFAMFLLTVTVALLMLAMRIRGVKNKTVHPKYFKVYNEKLPDDSQIQISRHFSNLFETPILFYTVCILYIITNLTSAASMRLAWAYVVARVVHAIIHIGPNHVIARMLSFLASMLILTFLWVNLVTSL